MMIDPPVVQLRVRSIHFALAKNFNKILKNVFIALPIFLFIIKNVLFWGWGGSDFGNPEPHATFYSYAAPRPSTYISDWSWNIWCDRKHPVHLRVQQ